jgi:hypothetical protein
MKIATKGSVLFAAAALLALPLVAWSQVVTETATHGQDEAMTVDHLLVSKDQGKSATNALTTIYDNTSSTPQVSVSSTDLSSQWGDELFTTGTGLLSTHKFTIFNSGANGGGALLTCSVSISFFNAVTSASLGGYSGNINFGAGLPAGSFSTITASGLDPFLILLNTTDIIVIQQVTAKTGTANRLGIVTLDPILIGSSPSTMFIASATVGGGVPGFYNIGAGGVPAGDPGHFLGVNPPPVPTLSKTWGSLKKLYH